MCDFILGVKCMGLGVINRRRSLDESPRDYGGIIVDLFTDLDFQFGGNGFILLK